VRLTSLDVSSVRNLSSITLEPEPGLNVLYGDNGAGKTSLLEAIAILSSGRSFRAGKIKTVIQNDLNDLTVAASVLNEVSQLETRIGITRGKERTQARINGSNAQRLSFVYRKGWSEELSLQEALNKNLAYCRRVGTTTSGPHRADIKIKVGSNEARYNNSRGQQKLLAIMMRLVQVDIYTEYHNHPPVLLFDDLPSELDKEARKFVFDYLQETGVQVLLTSVDDVTNEIHQVSKRFHVERGQIEKVLY